MTRRERVLKALNFEETDRVPMDLGGMDSTGISCFAYPDLVATLGLPPRPPRIHDTGQMLALPDLDVLDALDIDIATVRPEICNVYPQEELWHAYNFNGRLDARVRSPQNFSARADGTIVQGESTMPPASHVFNSEHSGQPVTLTGDIPKPDLKAAKAFWEGRHWKDKDLRAARDHCRRARESTDRAILLSGIGCPIGIGGYTGIAMFPMLCLTEPDFVLELHDTVMTPVMEQIGTFINEVHPYVDVYAVSSDDWGTQTQCVASPQTYRDLFKPYYRRVNDMVHCIAPQLKTFLHCCGAVYDLLDDFVESGFDALNPVQWTAGSHGYREWKDKARGRLVLWGGGVHTQQTLPLGSVEDVRREVAEVVQYMGRNGGYVFCAIHNLLAEIPGEKVVAMYRSAAAVRR